MAPVVGKLRGPLGELCLQLSAQDIFMYDSFISTVDLN